MKYLASLIAACICALLSIIILVLNLDINTQSQQVAVRYIESDSDADVLLIMSYDESDLNTLFSRKGVLDVMNRAAVNVDIVYMDARSAPFGSAAYSAWTSLLTDKVSRHGEYDAVICVDDEALLFMESNHEGMFPSTPVVFFGVNDFSNALRASSNGYMTGMIEQSYYGSIMQAAVNLHPDAKGFLAVVDETPAGIGNKAQFESAMAKFDNMELEYVNASDLTRDELASAVAGVGADTIVFLLDAGNDSEGNIYTLEENVSFVTGASNVPVYRGSMGGVGNGIAGSGYLDPESDGRRAAEITISILNGTRPGDIPLVTEGNLGYVFDDQVLNKYGLSSISVPFGSTVINRQIFSLDTLSLFLLPFFLLALALVLFLKSVAYLRQTSWIERRENGIACRPSGEISPDVERSTSVVARRIVFSEASDKQHAAGNDEAKGALPKDEHDPQRATAKSAVFESVVSEQVKQQDVHNLQSSGDIELANFDEISALLERSIDMESFVVFYQPQIDLHNNDVAGYEALARLKNKEYEPAQFIPVAEVTGQIVDIDRIVTKRAVEQLSIWKRRNKRVRPISINLSAAHLAQDDDYAGYLQDLLAQYDVAPEYIRIEITEALFHAGDNEAEEFLMRLFQAGIAIALDHFGTGFPTFQDIMTVPASIVKFDKCFVDTFLVDGNDSKFEQLVMLAQGFGKRVVVVGVDDKWQLGVCKRLNCDAVQGFYFSKPLLPENAVQYRPS